MSKRLTASRPLIDTNVFIGRKIPESVRDRMVISSVVLYELIAANIDDSMLKSYSSLVSKCKAVNRLLTPSANDWFECSKLVRNMLRGARSSRKGSVAKTTSAQQQQNDALIARTAQLHNCFVVTDNVKDFERFQTSMKDLVVVPADYFFDE